MSSGDSGPPIGLIVGVVIAPIALVILVRLVGGPEAMQAGAKALSDAYRALRRRVYDASLTRERRRVRDGVLEAQVAAAKRAALSEIGGKADFGAKAPSHMVATDVEEQAVAAAVERIGGRDLRCPITHEIMTDPVVACDGYTYEREAITKWLRHHDTSPETGLQLKNRTLVPNILARRLCESLISSSRNDTGIDPA